MNTRTLCVFNFIMYVTLNRCVCCRMRKTENLWPSKQSAENEKTNQNENIVVLDLVSKQQQTLKYTTISATHTQTHTNIVGSLLEHFEKMLHQQYVI